MDNFVWGGVEFVGEKPVQPLLNINAIVGRGGALLESKPFDR